jgi:hypothetical protein
MFVKDDRIKLMPNGRPKPGAEEADATTRKLRRTIPSSGKGGADARGRKPLSPI